MQVRTLWPCGDSYYRIIEVRRGARTSLHAMSRCTTVLATTGLPVTTRTAISSRQVVSFVQCKRRRSARDGAVESWRHGGECDDLLGEKILQGWRGERLANPAPYVAYPRTDGQLRRRQRLTAISQYAQAEEDIEMCISHSVSCQICIHPSMRPVSPATGEVPD